MWRKTDILWLLFLFTLLGGYLIDQKYGDGRILHISREETPTRQDREELTRTIKQVVNIPLPPRRGER